MTPFINPLVILKIETFANLVAADTFAPNLATWRFVGGTQGGTLFAFLAHRASPLLDMFPISLLFTFFFLSRTYSHSRTHDRLCCERRTDDTLHSFTVDSLPGVTLCAAQTVAEAYDLMGNSMGTKMGHRV